MTFETTKILTGIVPRVSKKTNLPYVMLNYLNEDGSTFSSVLKEDVKLPDGLKQLSPVKVEFEVTFYNGNVNGLKTLNLQLEKSA